MQKPQITLIGAITRDTIHFKNSEKASYGGAPFFAARVFNDARISCGIISKGDSALIRTLSKMRFVDTRGVARVPRITAIEIFEKAHSISANVKNFTGKLDISAVPKEFLSPDIFLISTVSDEIGKSELHRIKTKSHATVALDIQGYLRPKIKPNKSCRIKESDKRFNSMAKEILEEADVLKCNEVEFDLLTHNKGSIAQRMSSLSSLGPKTVIVTLGEKGAMLYANDKLVHLHPVRIIKSVHTVGAGDKFFALFLSHFVKTNDSVASGRFAIRRIPRYLVQTLTTQKW